MGRQPAGAVGADAERCALRFLVDRGLTPLTRNFHRRGGEIDLIMLDGDCLAFIEVRYRRTARFSAPAPTVDPVKQRKILRTAALYLARNRRYANYVMRFDVVAISGDGDTEWIRDAFRPADSTL